jgi:predicted regulator of Ras-like GTPase activity (Roadblock/LC7/MglB family)
LKIVDESIFDQKVERVIKNLNSSIKHLKTSFIFDLESIFIAALFASSIIYELLLSF